VAKNLLRLQRSVDKKTPQKPEYTSIKHALHFQRVWENGKSRNTWTSFYRDLKFKISSNRTFLQHGEMTKTGIWSLLKTVSSLLVITAHNCTSLCIIHSNVFRIFQDGGGIPGKTIATGPQPKMRRID
jgi:hypothetical protein